MVEKKDEMNGFLSLCMQSKLVFSLHILRI